MYKPNKPNRIRANDIHQRTCYYCWNIIEYEQPLCIHRGLPHHTDCVGASKHDLVRTKFIDELLDHYKLHESEDSYIRQIMRELKEDGSPITNYALDIQKDLMTVYVLTEQMVWKISMSYDERLFEYDVLQFPKRDMMFINRLFN